VDRRFRSLRIIGSIFKILAWVALIGGIVAGLAMIVFVLVGGAAAAPRLTALVLRGTPTAFGGFLAGIMVTVWSVLCFLVLYATGDAIFLALAIEENTRETAHYLKGGDTYGRGI
jgi:amino acid transporter